MKNKLIYFRSNPCYISSVISPLIIITTYYGDHKLLLLSEIPLSFSTILYHHQFSIKYIREIDIAISQFAFWQHLYMAYLCSNNFAMYIYLFSPIFYLLGLYFQKENKLYISNFIHSMMHYFLSIGTILINLNINNINFLTV